MLTSEISEMIIMGWIKCIFKYLVHKLIYGAQNPILNRNILKVDCTVLNLDIFFLRVKT